MSDFCFFIFIKKKNENIFIWFYLCATGFGLAEIKEYKNSFSNVFFKLVHFLFYTQKSPNVLSCLLSLSTAIELERTNAVWNWKQIVSFELQSAKKKHFFWKIKTFFECFFVYRCHGAISPLYCAEVAIVVQNASLYLCVLIIVLASIDKTRTANISFIKNASQLIFFFFRKTMPRIEEHHHMRV